MQPTVKMLQDNNTTRQLYNISEMNISPIQRRYPLLQNEKFARGV